MTTHNSTTFIIQNETQLAAFASNCSQMIPGGTIIGLTGDLASGKTTFTRHLAMAYNTTDWINSPTYSIVQHYTTSTLQIIHIDLYRCNNDHEIQQLDIPSMLSNTTLMVIEWINKTKLITPDITIDFSSGKGPSSRTLAITTSHKDWVKRLSQLSA